MNTITTAVLETELGELILGDYQGNLCLCDWLHRSMRAAIDSRITASLKAEYHRGETPILELAQRQIKEYLQGSRQVFDLPLTLTGSEFQKKVWAALLEIPYGQTISYSALAMQLGNPLGMRAVAAANGANALAIIIPCHRVISSDNDLTGYSGGLRAKQKLLQLESGGLGGLFAAQ